MTNIPTEAISFNMYYGGAAPEDEGDTTGEAKTEPVDDGTPQFRHIYIQEVLCRGARRAVQLQGLPEMPIRDIHLRNVAITATRGVVCQDAQDITLQGVEILNSQGNVVELIRSRGVWVDRLTHAPGAQTLLSLSGRTTAEISVRNTDLTAARQAIVTTGGATREAVRIE